MSLNFVVDTEALALELDSEVNACRGFPNDTIENWAVPKERATDGKWYLKKHPDCVAENITVAHTEETWAPTWIIAEVE